MVFLPLASLVVITLAIYRSSLKHGLRESFLFSSLIIYFLIFISCESLSIFQAISLPALFYFWVVILFWSVFILFRQPPRPWAALPSFTFFDQCMCLVIGLVIVATGLNAAISAVTSYDALVYHMARVAHWAQNHTIANYPTTIPLQVFASPFAEYILLHIYILGGGDHWVNGVSWLTWLVLASGFL